MNDGPDEPQGPDEPGLSDATGESTRRPQGPLGVEEWDQRVADMYAVPPAQFVSARDALWKEMRARGDHEYHEVKNMPKPTKLAWALDAAMRLHPEDGLALLDASEDLADAQRAALQGKGGDVLRQAQTIRNEALATCVAHVVAVLDEPGVRPEAEAGLLAVLGSEWGRRQWRYARLPSIPTAADDPGGGFTAGLHTDQLVASPRPTPPPQPDAAAPRRPHLRVVPDIPVTGVPPGRRRARPDDPITLLDGATIGEIIDGTATVPMEPPADTDDSPRIGRAAERRREQEKGQLAAVRYQVLRDAEEAAEEARSGVEAYESLVSDLTGRLRTIKAELRAAQRDLQRAELVVARARHDLMSLQED